MIRRRPLSRFGASHRSLGSCPRKSVYLSQCGLDLGRTHAVSTPVLLVLLGEKALVATERVLRLEGLGETFCDRATGGSVEGLVPSPGDVKLVDVPLGTLVHQVHEALDCQD